VKIVILGGGPCGLGAAWRLAELGHESWTLYEKNEYWGGLSASFQDSEGFWWDIGGHVLFSHYRYFDEVMDNLLGKEEGWAFHRREAWIWMQDRFVPYPLQNHIHHLPKEIYWECLKGVIDIHPNGWGSVPAHFGEWISATFGAGLAKWFLRPYNEKVWAYPPEMLDWSWVGERVAPVDLKRILEAAIFQKDDTSWGPNAMFRFPLYGGTGHIWRTLADRLPVEKLHLNKTVQRLSLNDHRIYFSDGTIEDYDVLLSTLCLTDLLRLAEMDAFSDSAGSLRHSSTHVVGLGLKGAPPPHLATKCWIYFPEDNCPFYRVTVFSNYSPNNVPEKNHQWSLMMEISESPSRKVDREQVVQAAIYGAIHTGLISGRHEISHHWYHFARKGYPTPVLGRNKILFPILGALSDQGVYSRGRFGAWRYEVGNMDHSFMQGVEFVNHLLASGEELTLWYPQLVNGPHPSGRRR
jgi:protoporphyrinogen oxidase